MSKPQCSANNIALTVNLVGAEKGEMPIIQRQTQNRQEAKRFIHQLEQGANGTGKLFTIELDLQCGHHIQMLCAVHMANEPCIAHQAIKESVAISSITNVRVGTVESERMMEPEEIVVYVDQALRDFHSTARLAKNPLTQFVNLDAYQVPGNRAIQVPGIALQQFLDQVITAISGVSAEEKLARSKWRLEHYLHLRYRAGIQHQDLASQLGYGERHLLRLRRELVLEVADLIINQST